MLRQILGQILWRISKHWDKYSDKYWDRYSYKIFVSVLWRDESCNAPSWSSVSPHSPSSAFLLQGQKPAKRTALLLETNLLKNFLLRGQKPAKKLPSAGTKNLQKIPFAGRTILLKNCFAVKDDKPAKKNCLPFAGTKNLFAEFAVLLETTKSWMKMKSKAILKSYFHWRCLLFVPVSKHLKGHWLHTMFWWRFVMFMSNDSVSILFFL